MLVRVTPVLATLLFLSACVSNTDEAGNPAIVTKQADASPTRTALAMTPGSVNTEDDSTFWSAVEAARARAGGDPEAMAEVLEVEFAKADDETLRTFQRELVDASRRLYTWRHWDAAEMICGYASDDVFTDWRSWVITLGRKTFARVIENPDNLADVADLSEACEGGAEIFGAAISGIYFERHGYTDETFPILEPFESPKGERVTDHEAIRRSMPRLNTRLREDGLGRPPRTSG
ncbi:DUF4240 domain-containing protein [Actinoplanes xinjiangensis]|uniref:DUF4240 domain-containing protein n=1 Tax=Actinoplanes xinjiangensis TaxID=512350 RepID=UPI003446E847